jgi:hypothetical protein
MPDWLRWFARIVAIVAIAVFAWTRFVEILPGSVTGTGVLRLAFAGCLGIDVDGDSRGLLAVETWPRGFYPDRDRRALVDASNAVVATEGDRISVTAIFVRDHGDIDPCDASERLNVLRFEIPGRPTPVPSPRPSVN